MRRELKRSIAVLAAFTILTIGLSRAIFWNSGDILTILFMSAQTSILVVGAFILAYYVAKDRARERKLAQIREAQQRRASFRNVIISPKFLELPTNESGLKEIVQREW